jgi:ABC-type nitrate/sulfonate/bicarbonate transport system permease component
MIQQNRVLLQTPNVVAGMATIGAIGFAMSALMGVAERRLIGWSQAVR